MSQVSGGQFGLSDLLIDFGLELVEGSLKAGGHGRCIGQALRYSRTVQASMNTGEVQRRAESEVGDTIAMGFGNSLDHAVETEPAQVIGHPSLRDHVGRLPGEQSELLSQITIGETAGKQRNQTSRCHSARTR